MGHYASEMQCDKCGKLRCICPRRPDETLKMWVYDKNFNVMLGSEFEKRDGTTYAHFNRVMRDHFGTKEAAQDAAKVSLANKIIKTKEKLQKLEDKLASYK